MENLKKLLYKLIFPHIAVLILLILLSAAALVLAFAVIPEYQIFGYCSYVLSAYTLTAVCFRMPKAVNKLKSIKESNKYVNRYSADPHLRIKLSLLGAFVFNTAYALFQLALGIGGGSLWFYSLSGYYFLLALMRLALLNHTAKHSPGELMFRERLIYRFCGMLLLLMTITLTVIITYVARTSQASVRGEIITIALAAFTFTSFSVAIVNVVKYRRFNSPVWSASKALSFVSALVSMLTLEDAMLASFGGAEDDGFRTLMVALTGAGISAIIISIAISMIVRSTKKIKIYKAQDEEKNEHG